MAETTVAGKTEMLSLQARIEQCEAAIQTAHSTLNRIESIDQGTEKTPEVAGAVAAIDRCNHQMADLNARLSAVAEKVGAL